MELVADDSVERAEGKKVFTRNGREIEADVVVPATGFRVRDCEFLFYSDYSALVVSADRAGARRQTYSRYE